MPYSRNAVVWIQPNVDTPLEALLVFCRVGANSAKVDNLRIGY